jgi:catalase
MRFDENVGGSVNYEPNSFGGPVEDRAFREPPLPVSGAADRYDHGIGNYDYSQPGALFRLMSDDQKRQFFDNFAAAMRGVPEAIQLRQEAHFAKADPAYGHSVTERLGLTTHSRPPNSDPGGDLEQRPLLKRGRCRGW